MRTRLARRAGALLAVALAIAASSPAHADFINGNFPQGLTGYNVTSADDVTVGTNQATINQDPSFSVLEVDLSQTLTIPVGATAISFDLVGYNTDTAFTTLPPGFGVSLLDPTTGKSLVTTVDSSTDSFFTLDLTNGNQGLASGVTVSPASTGGSTVTVDLPSTLTNGTTNAEMLFRLIDGGDNGTANVTITNLAVEAPSSPVSAVPEPSGFVLAGIGILSLSFCYLKRRPLSVRG